MKKSYVTDFVAEGEVFHAGELTEYVVGYARFSSENQDYSSIEYQHEGIKGYCKRNNMCLLKIFTDEAQTATNDRRVSFQQMVAEAKGSPVWSKIIVFDYTRYSRNIYDALSYLRIFKDNGIELVSATEPYCAGEDSAAFMCRMNAFTYSAVSSMDNAKRTHAGMKVKASKGLFCGGKPPLGYDIVNQQYEINEQEAEAVRLIFDLYEKGYTYKNIARKLNKRGCLNKNGDCFNERSFQSILTQEKYTGVHVWNRAVAADSYGRHNTHKQKPIEEQIHVPDALPVIISREQFERVQRRRTNKDGLKARRSNSHHYMLSGLKKMICAECGAYMVGMVKTSGKNVYYTYSCPNHKKKTCSMKDIRADKLDKLVAGNLVADLYTRSDIHKIFASMCYDERYYILKDRLGGIEEKTRNVMKVVSRGCEDSAVAELRKLKNEKENLKSQISIYEAKMDVLNGGNLKGVVTSFGNSLIHSDEPEIVDFLQENISSIIVDHDEITVTFNVA